MTSLVSSKILTSINYQPSDLQFRELYNRWKTTLCLKGLNVLSKQRLTDSDLAWVIKVHSPGLNHLLVQILLVSTTFVPAQQPASAACYRPAILFVEEQHNCSHESMLNFKQQHQHGYNNHALHFDSDQPMYSKTSLSKTYADSTPLKKMLQVSILQQVLWFKQ